MKTVIINGIVEGLTKAVKCLLKLIVLGVIKSSYIICLTACLISIILYILGEKKAGKYVSISFVIYVIIQALKGVLI